MTNIATEETPTQTPKPKRFLIPVLAGVVVLLLAAGGWFVYSQQQAELLEVGESAEIAPTALVKKPQFTSMPRFVVSIEGENRLHYLMLELSLMSYDPEQLVLVEDMMPVLRNAVVKLLNGKTYEELSKAGGLPGLEQEILLALHARMNEMTGQKGIERVLITKLVVQ